MNRNAKIAITVLSTINVAGIVGLTWLAWYMLRYDSLMVTELSILGGLIAALIATTVGAYTLRRRHHIALAIILLALTAVPTIGAIGLMLYINSHPIDWR